MNITAVKQIRSELKLQEVELETTIMHRESEVKGTIHGRDQRIFNSTQGNYFEKRRALDESPAQI